MTQLQIAPLTSLFLYANNGLQHEIVTAQYFNPQRFYLN